MDSLKKILHKKPATSTLFDIIKKNEIKKLLKLIKKGVNLNTLNENGFSPLQVATQFNRLECIELLCQNGANVDLQTTNKNITALHIAVECKFLNALKILLPHSTNPNLPDSNGITPFHKVCFQREISIPMANEFLSANAPVYTRDNHAKTALYHAISLYDPSRPDPNRIAYIKLLIQNGANISPECSDYKKIRNKLKKIVGKEFFKMTIEKSNLLMNFALILQRQESSPITQLPKIVKNHIFSEALKAFPDSNFNLNAFENKIEDILTKKIQTLAI